MEFLSPWVPASWSVSIFDVSFLLLMHSFTCCCLFIFRYGLIFPLFVPYLCDIPRITRTHILGIPVTGKTLTYLVGLQVCSTSIPTAVSAFCSVVRSYSSFYIIGCFHDALGVTAHQYTHTFKTVDRRVSLPLERLKDSRLARHT